MSPAPIASSAPESGLGESPRYLDFEDLYRDTRDSLYAYVMGLMRDRHCAEEITSQAFEKAFRSRNRFDRARGEARAWLFTLARNAALDEMRRQKRHAIPT